LRLLRGQPRSAVVTRLAAVLVSVLVAFVVWQQFDAGLGGRAFGPPEISLSEAVAEGDLSSASALLDAGAAVDEPVFQGFTPMMRAAIRDDREMIALLLAAGADLEAEALAGLTVLHTATEAGAAEAVDGLLEAGADPDARSYNGMNALEHAAAAGSAEAIRIIAATGADVDAQSETTATGHGYPVDIGSTALGIAARAGHIDAIVALLGAGARIDAPSMAGHTPLLVAIFARQPPEVISVLLEAGADPTVTAACRTRCNYDEGDALTWAHRIGDPDVAPLIKAALDR
jgi:ankyrin repeat protein